MNRNRKIARKYFENREIEKKRKEQQMLQRIQLSPKRHPIKDAGMPE